MSDGFGGQGHPPRWGPVGPQGLPQADEDLAAAARAASSADLEHSDLRSHWQDAVPTVGSIELPPDPRALEGLGRNHSLETALADLVDNSIDAGASHVLICFVRKDGWIRTVYAVDNGIGMSCNTIDNAMTVGGNRMYGSSDLGRFGLGLKAASFSQATELTVLSRATNSEAVGRRWQIAHNHQSFLCDVVPSDFARTELQREWGIPQTGTGTVVRWDNLRNVPATADPARVESFLTRTNAAILSHLGLVFHRLITDGRIDILIGVEDIDVDGGATKFRVEPIDPFGYSRSGHQAFPKTLTAHSDHQPHVSFHCHIWPGRSNVPSFKLGDSAVERQGLYFYRRDRLLQAGGWDGIHAADQRLQLARVVVEIDDDVTSLFRMNPEKSRVLVGPEFAHLAEHAVGDDGTTFADYFQVAEESYRRSRERSRNRRRMIAPGKGFAPHVRRTIEDEIPLHDRPDELHIRWKRLSNDAFFEIDRQECTLWLNERYRQTLLGNRRGGLNDLPVIKALLYLLVEEIYQGEHLGPRDKDNIELWQDVLSAAARSEKP